MLNGAFILSSGSELLEVRFCGIGVTDEGSGVIALAGALPPRREGVELPLLLAI